MVGDRIVAETKIDLELQFLKKKIGAPGVTRTPGTRIRNPLLYPPELQGHINVFNNLSICLLLNTNKKYLIHHRIGFNYFSIFLVSLSPLVDATQ